MKKVIVKYEAEMYYIHECSKVKDCNWNNLIESYPELQDVEDYCREHDLEIIKYTGL